jgi:hypothetical protein
MEETARNRTFRVHRSDSKDIRYSIFKIEWERPLGILGYLYVKGRIILKWKLKRDEVKWIFLA